MQIDETKAALIEALAQNAAFDGWTVKSLRLALSGLGRDPGEAELAFPGGRAEMIEAYFSLNDERLIAAPPLLQGTTARVRAAVLQRLALMAGEKEAVRRALPWLTPLILARMADAIWYAAGDRSADFSWYSKRAILTAVVSATLLYWINDTSPDFAATAAFLDRRLQGVARIGKLRRMLPFRKAA